MVLRIGTREEEILKVALLQSEHTEAVRKAACAIVMTEMTFRQLPHRCVEFIFAFGCLAFGRSPRYMTLGIAQISVWRLCKMQGHTEAKATLLLMSKAKSIEACCYFLAHARLDDKELGDPKALASVYNGKATPFYLRRLRIYLDEVDRTVRFRNCRKTFPCKQSPIK